MITVTGGQVDVVVLDEVVEPQGSQPPDMIVTAPPGAADAGDTETPVPGEVVDVDVVPVVTAVVDGPVVTVVELALELVVVDVVG